MFNSGFVKSVTFGVPSFNAPNSVPDNYIPEKYDIREELNLPVDQGSKGICVSVCITDMVRYLHTIAKKQYKKRSDFFYNHRSNKAVDGMSPRNAFEIAQAYGLLMSYATLKTLIATRLAIVANGPAMIALPVYGQHTSFWKPSLNSPGAVGYHAVTFVGYDDTEQYFILRNSWGPEWGTKGYTFFPYDDFNLVLEAWTAFK